MAKPPFQPEYVTEHSSEHPTHSEDAPPPFDYDTESSLARERVLQHVARHREYPGRDRDLLLLRLLDATERLDDRLAGFKRSLDVLATRVK